MKSISCWIENENGIKRYSVIFKKYLKDDKTEKSFIMLIPNTKILNFIIVFEKLFYFIYIII